MPDLKVNLLAVAALGVVLSACGTAGEIRAQRQDLTRLQEESANCRAASRAPGTFQACAEKYGPDLTRLGQQALDEAGRSENTATRIGVYSLAANAGWESGTDAGFQVADAAIQAGTTLCSSTSASTPQPPRDCALLQAGPGFVAHMRTLALVDRIESKPPASVTPTEKQQLSEASANYVRRTFDFVEGRRRQFGANPNLDASVLTLLDRQRAVFYCTALHLSTVNRKLGQVEAARRVSRDRDRVLAADPALRGETCLLA